MSNIIKNLEGKKVGIICSKCERHNVLKTKWCWGCGSALRPVKQMNTPGMFEAMALMNR